MPQELRDKMGNVLYGGVAKEETDICYALESGIEKFSIESFQQLEILSGCAKKFNVKPEGVTARHIR